MTQTTQLRSWALINNPGKDLTINKKPEAEDNMSLLLSVLDSLNNLSEKINKLDYLIQKKAEELPNED
jgi:hypothetical protein